MRYVGLDTSTKTGLVILDEQGRTVTAKRIEGIGNVDPYRMATMIDEIMRYMKKDDFITIENFGFASQRAVQLGGIGWGVRMALLRKGFKYYDIAPGQLKKYASGNGKADKKELIEPVKRKWGFYSSDDNIMDAYVLAQIGRSMRTRKVNDEKEKEVLLKIFQTINETGKKK